MSSFQTRLTQLRRLVPPQSCWLISKPSDIAYFTDFCFLVPEQEREALLLITHQAAWLITSQFSPSPSKLGNEVIILKGLSSHRFGQHLADLSTKLPSQIFIDESHLQVNELRQLEKNFRKVENLDRSLLWQLRMVKDAKEQSQLKRAGKIAAKAWSNIKPQIKAGQTELEVKQIVETELRRHGSQQPAFPVIVAFGSHAAAPHHQPTNSKLKDNQAVLIDFGATINNYRSDMTRTFWFGDQPHPRFNKIARAVDRAYQAALHTLKTHDQPTAADLDTTARSMLAEHNLDKYFIHTTGHGLGLDIHEQPSLHQTVSTPLVPGMAITIEPGVYISKKFGYRYENTILIGTHTVTELTKDI